MVSAPRFIVLLFPGGLLYFFVRNAMLQLFGGKYKQKLLFVPDADNKPEDKHEISEPALFRFLIKEKAMEQLDAAAEAETTQMQRILKDIERNTKITEFEPHQSSMGSATDSSKAFHVFIVFKTTSKKDGDYWWSLEKNTDYIVLQRSRNKDNVKNKLYGESRKKVKPIKENLAGKGTIKDLFSLLWDQQVIPEKYNVLYSNCQSLVTLVSKQMTEIGYEYQGVFKCSPPLESGRNKKMLDLINLLRVSYGWHPLFTLILMENTHLFDQITKSGEYNMGIMEEGLAPLHIAISFSKTKMVQHFLKPPYSVDPTKRDENGMNALDITAALTKQPEIIDLLLAHSKAQKGIDDTTAVDKDAAGVLTAQKGKKMGDVNDRNERGWTALHYAAYASNEITAEHLIQKGADVNHRNNDGRTPLHVAALFAKDMNTIDVLLRNIRKGDVEQYKKDATLLPEAMHNKHGLGGEIIGRLVTKGMVSNEQVQNPQV
jgi:ankyrin repeat protein